MAETADDLEKLLTDVRKTITDNKYFLDKLLDETVEVDVEKEQPEEAADGDDFEEL